ncbi:MAG TPA: hypothetical protein VL172_05170 [Kofleriaceae bacterium]|nr:hypothetical protein [Kofleriaceae bacterium]
MSTELVRHAQPVSLMTQSQYRIKRNFWSFLERTFRVSTMDGQLTMLIKHPVLKLREEFTVWGDEARTQPLLLIKSRQVVAINYCFDVTDAGSGQVLGTVHKQGLKSLVRDKFKLLDPNGTEIGYMEEQGASLLRRFLPFLTSHHRVFIGDRVVADIHQKFRFFTKEFTVALDTGAVDPRFVMACALLALIAEARREDR